MGLTMRCTPIQSQQLTLTPQLQQAVKLLQLSHQEIATLMREALAQNPLLEEVTAYDYHPAGNHFINPTSLMISSDQYRDRFSLPASFAQSLNAWLQEQIQLSKNDRRRQQLMLRLIADLDDNGYLPADICQHIAAEYQITFEEVETALTTLQQLDPPGVAARSVQECLLIQAERRCPEDQLVRNILQYSLKHLEHHNVAAMMKQYQVSKAQTLHALRTIRSFAPKPGSRFALELPQYITADVHVIYEHEKYQIILNQEGLPRLKLSDSSQAALQNQAVTPVLWREKLKHAAFLLRSLKIRANTLTRVMESIVTLQRPFFDHGPAYLRPLVLKKVASAIKMHESTVSRITQNKYVLTPHGIFPLKYFFTAEIQSSQCLPMGATTVRSQIGKMIGNENSQKPLSDAHIVMLLRCQNIIIARRTVTKYRQLLKIPTAARRRAMAAVKEFV